MQNTKKARGFWNTKFIITSVCLLLVLASLATYVGITQVSAKETFEQDGYVLNSSLEEAEADNTGYAQYYFRAQSTYEKKWPSKVTFYDTESSKVTLGTQSFLHYNNGDTGAFADGVVVDLDNVNQTPVTYYRVQAGAILKKSGDTYQMNYLNDKITMRNFIWKLSDTKYMVVSSDMTLHLNENTERSISGFIEVDIQDQGIVSFRNQEVAYQTVVQDAYVRLADGTVIDFTQKTISQNDQPVLYLAQMVVDSNDNVEIVQKENKSNTSSNSGNGNSNGNGAGNADGSTDGNGNSGNGNNGTGEGGNTTAGGEDGNFDFGNLNLPNMPNAGEDGKDNGDDSASQTVPSVQLTELKASLTGVSLKANIVDPDDILTDAGVNVKIYEKSTNKLVYTHAVSHGEQSIDVTVETLKTNTDYTLVINGTYMLGNVEYTNDFLNKQFRTDVLDLTYAVSEVNSDSLKYKIHADSDTKVTGATFVLYNAEKQQQQTISLTGTEMSQAANGGYEATFSGLQSNTQYYVKMTNVVYNSSLTISDYDDYKGQVTLKTTPTLGTPTVSVDKRNASFVLYPGSVTDLDRGVQKYRFEILDAADDTQVIYSTEREILGNVEVPVDGKNIHRNRNYIYRLVALFDDNQKVVEVTSGNSEIFALDTKKLPTITFESTVTHHDAIEGTLTIDDTESVMLKGQVATTSGVTQQAKVSLTATDAVGTAINLGIAATTDVTTENMQNGKLTIPVNITGLRANESHIFKVYADVNLGESSNGTSGGTNDATYNRFNYYIGEVHVKTLKTSDISVSAQKDYSSDNAILQQKYVLNVDLNEKAPGEGVEASTVETGEYTASTMQQLKYVVYQGQVTADQINSTTTRLMKLGEQTLTATGTTAQSHQSSLKTSYYDVAGSIKAGDIGYSGWDTYQHQYVTVLFTEASDYVGNKIELGDVSTRLFQVRVNSKAPEATNKNDAVDVTVVKNSMLGNSQYNQIGTSKDSSLDNDTVVGFLFRARVNNSGNSIRKITYTIKDAEDNKTIKTIVKELTETNNTIEQLAEKVGNGEDAVTLTGQDLKRGHKYKVEYTLECDLNGNGVAETTLTGFTSKTDSMNAPRQKASFKTRFDFKFTGTTLAQDSTTNPLKEQYVLVDKDAYYRGTNGNIEATQTFNASETPAPAGENTTDDGTDGDGTDSDSNTTKITLTRSTNENAWNTLNVSNVKPGLVTITVKTNEYSSTNNDQNTEIFKQRVYTPASDPSNLVQAEAKIEDNQFKVIVSKKTTASSGSGEASAAADTEVTDEQYAAIMKAIAGVKITVSEKTTEPTPETQSEAQEEGTEETPGPSPTITPVTQIKGLTEYQNGTTTAATSTAKKYVASIPLSDLSNFANKELSVKTEMLYVQGSSTTNMETLNSVNSNDTEKLYAVELSDVSKTEPAYLYHNGSSSSLAQQSTAGLNAINSVFKVQNTSGTTYKLTNQVNNQDISYTAAYTKYPLELTLGTVKHQVIFKELAAKEVATTATNDAKFTTIAGEITMKDADQNPRFVKGIDRINVTYSLDMTKSTAKVDNKVYFEIYEKDNNGNGGWKTTPTYVVEDSWKTDNNSDEDKVTDKQLTIGGAKENTSTVPGGDNTENGDSGTEDSQTKTTDQENSDSSTPTTEPQPVAGDKIKLNFNQDYQIKVYTKQAKTTEGDGTTTTTGSGADSNNGSDTGAGTTANTEKVYLYETVTSKQEDTYDFKTSDTVKVTNLAATLESTKTEGESATVTRNMKLTYNVDQIGFTKVVYKVYALKNNTSDTPSDEDTEVASDDKYDSTPIYTKEVTQDFDKTSLDQLFPVGQGNEDGTTGASDTENGTTKQNQKLKLGTQYKLTVEIYSTKNPYGTGTQETKIGSGNFEFKLEELRNPIVNVQLVPSQDTTDNTKHIITATVNVSDLDYVSAKSKYKVKLLDNKGNDVTPEDKVNEEYSFSDKNKSITFEKIKKVESSKDGAENTENLKENTEYTVVVSVDDVDRKADGNTTAYQYSTSVTTLNSHGISFGNIELSKSATNQKVDLIFTGAVNLTKVKTIKYTVYNSNTGSSTTYDETFTVTQYGSGANTYHTTVLSGFTASGRYTVQIQFYGEGNTLVGETSQTITYR